MPKTAILVTFQATTRIVINVPDGVTLEQYLDNDFNWSSVSRTARNKMQGNLGDYLCKDNMSVEEDTEILAAPIEAIDVDPEKNGDEYQRISEETQKELIGTKYSGVENLKKKLSHIVGKPCKCYDSGIDDKADDDEKEDGYIMKSCFCFDDSSVIVRVYYGDVTREIGYVDVTGE